MRNVRSGLALAAAAVATAIPLTLLSTAAGAAAKSADQDQLGTITIQSWIHAYPSDNVLSATDTDCFKISGAIADQAGGPTWANDSQFSAPTAETGNAAESAASKECSDPEPWPRGCVLPRLSSSRGTTRSTC